MVSTRGGARTSGPEETLKKQPVRRTTAKTTKAAAAKPKATRSKKVEKELESEPTLDDEEPDELQEEAPAPAARQPERKATTTGKKDQDAPKTATRATKSSTTRATKATVASEKAKPAVEKAKPTAAKAKPAAEKTKSATEKTKTSTDKKVDLTPPTAQSRATRATRATEAKGKAPPLSPKKVTQVSKAPAKSARTASGTTNTKKIQPKPAATRGRPRAKRNISDENASIAELEPAQNDLDEIEVAAPKKAEKSKSAPNKKPTTERAASGSSTPVSTRPSTPAEALLEDAESEPEEHLHVPEIQDSESEAEEESGEVASGDELMGPKTPMKRISPIKMSTQQGVKAVDADVPMKTPVRRFAVLGTQKGTPQTQKPYRKPEVPMADIGPMTVARARDRAMVFPQLNTFDLKVPQAVTSNAEESSEELEESEGSGAAEESEIPQDDVTMTDNEEAGHSLANFETMENTLEPKMDGQDPDETIVVNEFDDDQEKTSFEDNESVLITRGSISPNSFVQDEEMPAKTPRPETVNWENVTIPFDFDATPRGLPSVETEESIIETTDSLVGRQSLDATVHLSEFIDVKSLSESPKKNDNIEQSSTIDEVPAHSPHSPEATPAVEIAGLKTPPQEPSADERQLEEEAASQQPITVAYDGQVSAGAAMDDDEEEDMVDMPSYARPTLSSRRKSVSSLADRAALLKAVDRRKTAGPALATLEKTPKKNSTSTSNTPAAKMAETPSTSAPLPSVYGRKPVSRMLFAQTPSTSVPQSISQTPKERFPGMPSRQTYEELPDALAVDGDSTPASVTPQPTQKRFPGLPSRETYEDSVEQTTTPSQPAEERFPGLPSRETYEELPSALGAGDETDSEQAQVQTPPQLTEERFPGQPSRQTYEEISVASENSTLEQGPATPLPTERYPGLPSKRSYHEHAQTAMPATRFRSPASFSPRRPATAQKPMASLRKVALKASATPMKSNTPTKTPLKNAAMTPGMEFETPHPAAPLRGVVALVEVFTSDGGNATPTFTGLLQGLGAKTTKSFSERVTHLVFKEGSPTTLQRLRVHNKQVAETGIGNEIFCVNIRWANDCKTQGKKMDEHDENYSVDVEDVPRAGKRRRKSMEPSTLMNVGGNMVRDRKSSLGRPSLLGRTPIQMDTPPENKTLETTPNADKENSGEDSPVTPAYLSAPDSLIQQTAPINRVRNLDFSNGNGIGQAAKSRRLTSWDAGEF